MDKFIVSARKYRPQAFDTVVGQSHIITTLKNAIKNQQLAHAFLFCGPRGVGKTTCARILAKTINCQNLQADGEACNECNSCKSFNEGTSFNIHELDAASNNSVDDIRSLVEQVRFAPQAGKYKVYIVDEVHMLSTSAFNAFLKTLEEPPSYAIFILATTEKYKILPTILSRCQIFDFKRITNNDTVEHLEEIVKKESIKAEKAALQLIAQKSEGCMRDALSIMDKITSFTNGELTYQNTLEHLNILDQDYYFKLLGYLLEQDMASVLLLYDEVSKKGFEGDLVLNGFAEFVRNILVCKDVKAAALLDVVEGMQEKYTSTASNVETAYLISTLNILNEAEINYKMARNKRLHVELTLIKLNFLQQAIQLTTEDTTLVKKKRLDTASGLKWKSIQSLQPASQGSSYSVVNKHIVKEQPDSKLYSEISLTVQKELLKKQSDIVSLAIDKEGLTKQETLTTSIPATRSKKNLLDTLKEKYGDQYHIEEVKEAELLNMEKLRQYWNDYTEKLFLQQKHSAVQTFKAARLNIENDIHFTVTVDALTQQKFVEQEKMLLIDSIQKAFNNRGISFSVIIEKNENEKLPEHLTLNSRQRFEKIAEQYPLVKALKERLKLELDY